MTFLDLDELHAGLDTIRGSPRDRGLIELIVRRPAESAREVVAEADVDSTVGVVGDNWRERGSRSTPDGAASIGTQITLMNSRAAALIAGAKERWALAGDQFYVDFDLSSEHLPPGTRLALGDSIVEVSEVPHRGCKKFVARFGRDAMHFVNTGPGPELNLRGINARVVRGGRVRIGDAIEKLAGDEPL